MISARYIYVLVLTDLFYVQYVSRFISNFTNTILIIESHNSVNKILVSKRCLQTFEYLRELVLITRKANKEETVSSKKKIFPRFQVGIIQDSS